MTWQDMRSGYAFVYEPGENHVNVLTDDLQRRVDTIAATPADYAAFMQLIDAYDAAAAYAAVKDM